MLETGKRSNEAFMLPPGPNSPLEFSGRDLIKPELVYTELQAHTPLGGPEAQDV